MGLANQINKGLRMVVDALAGEEVIFNGTRITAIINESSNGGTSLGYGAMNNERTLVIQFKTGLVTIDLKGRNLVEARGEKWQISTESDSVRIGAAATTLTLIEPQRRRES